MAELPGGLPGDVFFGDPSQPLPDWRKDYAPDDESYVRTPEEYDSVEGFLGFRAHVSSTRLPSRASACGF